MCNFPFNNVSNLLNRVNRINLQFEDSGSKITVMKKTLISLALLLLISGTISNKAHAQQMEFNVGFAFDNPNDEPLPALSGGFGYNFSACLWLKEKYGLAVGAMGTKHEFDAGSRNNRSYRLNAERDVLFIEGRYKMHQTKRWEFIGLAGYTFNNNIHGGDSTGGYVEFQDSSSFDSENIGYKGSGYWLGLSVHRAIQSFHQGYFMFASVRYMIVKYRTNQYYYIEPGEGSQHDLLIYSERDSNIDTNSLSIHLGVVLRFDFDNF